jgi:peptidyl-Asp metalloendopeptidase
VLSGDAGSCGIAFVGSNKAYMFSVSSYTCATGYYSFGHELAHNMNALHDRGTTNTCGPTTSYNYGFRDPKAAFRSIMAYDCQIGQCDNMTVNGCPRVQRFSNKAYLYKGKAIGDASHDNARQINEKRAYVASFYPAMNCQRNSECNDGNPKTVDTCNTANAVCVFT